MKPQWADYWTHCEVLGAPRTGKTSFIACCKRIHVLAGNRVIDFTGGKDDSFDQLMAFIVRANPEYPCRMMDLSSANRITGYNPFRLPTGRNLSAHVSHLAEALLSNVSGQPISDLQNYAETAECFFAHIALSNEPLPSAVRLFQFSNRKDWARLDLPEQFRYQAIAISETDAKNWTFAIGALRRRLRTFITSDAIQLMLAAPDPISISELYEQGMSLFVKAAPSAHLAPEPARIVLAFLLSDLLQVGIEHAGENKKYFCYCDEAQLYAPPNFGDLLDTSLSAGLMFTVAHHHDLQFPDERLRESIKTSCQIKVVFGGLSARIRKGLAEDAWPELLNEDWHRQPRISHVTEYDEEDYETFTESEGGSDGFVGEQESGSSHSGSSVVRGTRLRPHAVEIQTGWDDYSMDEKLSKLAQAFVLPKRSCRVILPDRTELFRVPSLRPYLTDSPQYREFIGKHGVPRDHIKTDFERSTTDGAPKRQRGRPRLRHAE